jgi:hypothetical protein
VDRNALESKRVVADLLDRALVDAWPAAREDVVAGSAEAVDPWLPAVRRHPHAVDEHDAGFLVALAIAFGGGN